MPDDNGKTGGSDDQRINFNQDHDVQYWTQKLGVTAAQLHEAVKAVGPMVNDVKRYLGKS